MHCRHLVERGLTPLKGNYIYPVILQYYLIA
jgi:hypothetical protein